jgi:hypothetical protein
MGSREGNQSALLSEKYTNRQNGVLLTEAWPHSALPQLLAQPIIDLLCSRLF